jgi:hypothetical protein
LDIEKLRAEFEQETNRSIAMPTAGAIVWAFAGLVSLKYQFGISVYILLFSTGAILPLALIVARARHEVLLSSKNTFAKLMGLCVLMVNLLWGVTIPLAIHAPEFVPLSLGIGAGIHWIVYSWIIQHSLGVIHAVLRTILVVTAWYVFPESRIFAISAAIVFVYCVSIFQMCTRKIVTT